MTTRCVAGVNFGRYVDSTGVVVLKVDGERLKVVAIEEIGQMSFESQVEEVAKVLEGFSVGLVLADQVSVGDELLDMLRRRIWEAGAKTRIEGVRKTRDADQSVVKMLCGVDDGKIDFGEYQDLSRDVKRMYYEHDEEGRVKLHPFFLRGVATALGLAFRAACPESRLELAKFVWGRIVPGSSGLGVGQILC